MPTYQVPRSDVDRLAFMNRAMKTANAIPVDGTQRLPAQLLTDLTAHYAAYRAAYDAVEAALSQRKTETAESAAAMARLEMFISHLWTAVYNRAQRENQPVGVLGYYKLNNDGSRPTPTRREEWLEMALSVINGDAMAVADGYPAAVNPSAAEVQAVYDTAVAETDDVPAADAAYGEAQAAVAALRPQADKLIKATRAAILYSTYDMEPAAQRRILRNYGSVYRYLPDEPVDEGDDTAVVG